VTATTHAAARNRGIAISHDPIASNVSERYHHDMAKVNKFEVEPPVPMIDDEDEETLAAIDEGIRDAEAGRTVPSQEARKLMPQWISASSTHKKR
jgi:hypothetical protein